LNESAHRMFIPGLNACCQLVNDFSEIPLQGPVPLYNPEHPKNWNRLPIGFALRKLSQERMLA
jgi:hypothetical protein